MIKAQTIVFTHQMPEFQMQRDSHEDMVSSGDVAAAFHFDHILVEAAQVAGCKHVTGSRPPRHQKRDKPHFDDE